MLATVLCHLALLLLCGEVLWPFVDLHSRKGYAPRLGAHLVCELVPFLEVMPPHPRFASRGAGLAASAELCLSARAPSEVMGAGWRRGEEVLPVQLETVRRAGPLGLSVRARLPEAPPGSGSLHLRARDASGRLRERALGATVLGP